jgi:hypothetical protein
MLAGVRTILEACRAEWVTGPAGMLLANHGYLSSSTTS